MVLAAMAVSAAAAWGGQPERHVLENGATLLLLPVEGVEQVGMETFFRVGFFDEPAGLTQAAHLCEHLVCQGATASFKPGESMAWMNSRGMANAETLATFTHYDATGAAPDLPEMLRIEGERLASLEIDEAIVAQEAPRCYAEVSHIESLPQAPVFKFAMMAAHQGWRHGKTEALVKGGLVEAGIEPLRAFHAAHYSPENMVVVIAGGFDAAAALQLARQTIGAVQRPASVTPEIDWNAVPRRLEMTWDAAATVVFVAFPPPTDPAERLILSMWGGTAAMRMMQTDPMKGAARSARVGDTSAPVGALPVLLFAVAAEGVDAAQAEERLMAFAAAEAERQPTDMDVLQIRMMAQQIATPPQINPAMLAAAAQQWRAQMPGLDDARARGMVLGNAALQVGMVELLVGGEGREDAWKKAREIDAAGLKQLLRRTLDAGRAMVTVLRPKA